MSKKNQVRRAQQRQQPKKRKSSSPPVGKPSHQERLEDARHARRRRSLLTRIAFGAAVAAILVGAGAWKARSYQEERQAARTMTAGGCSFDRRSDPGAVNEHTASPTFKVDPPSGGVHDPAAAAPGVYAETSLPSDGRVVHALEHGDIALWYRPNLAEGQLAKLQALADRAAGDVLLMPRAGLTADVAAVAWHKRLLCPSLDPEAVTTFVDRYADEGPENQPD